MRDNPNASRAGLANPWDKTLLQDKKIIFYHTYRTLLDNVFGGRLGDIEEALTIMVSLGLQANNLMALPLDELQPTSETCGPIIFDYH